MHNDLSGPVSPTAKEGYRYAICFVDDYSGLTNVYFLKWKSNAVKATKKYLTDIKPYGNVKRIRKLSMKCLVPNLHIRMVQLQSTGGHFLTWQDVCYLNLNYQNAYGHTQF